MKLTKPQKRSHKRLYISLLVALAIVIGTGTLAYTQNLGPFSKEKPTSEDVGAKSTDLNQDNEQAESNDNTDQSTPQNSTKDSPTSITQPNQNTSLVSVTISQPVDNAVLDKDFSVKSIVNTLETGKCRIKIFSGSITKLDQVKKTSHATSYVVCGEFNIKTDTLGPGKHTIEVSYTSNTGDKTGKTSIQATIR